MPKGIHDLPLNYSQTHGHEMQIRVHAPEGADVADYIHIGRGLMVDLVDEAGFNSIPHLERRHSLDDGTTINVRQSYGVQVIDIYPAGKVDDDIYSVLFSFEPKYDKPKAIISAKKNGDIKLYFDPRIRAGGVYTQEATNDFVYSLNADSTITMMNDCNAYYKVSRDYPAYGFSQAEKDVFVGGYLLYKADYDVIGVGVINGIICLVTIYYNTIRFYAHSVIDINLKNDDFDTALIASGDFTLVKTLIVDTFSGSAFSASTCSFSSTGEAAFFLFLETVHAIGEDKRVIEHHFNISLSVEDGLVVDETEIVKEVFSTIENDGNYISNPITGEVDYGVIMGGLTLGTELAYWNGEYVFGSPDEYTWNCSQNLDSVIQAGDDWISSHPGEIQLDGLLPGNPDCFNDSFAGATVLYESYTLDSANKIEFAINNIGPAYCYTVQEIRDLSVTDQDGSQDSDGAQAQDYTVFNSFSANNIKIVGLFNSNNTSKIAGTYYHNNYNINYTVRRDGTLQHTAMSAATPIVTEWVELLNAKNNPNTKPGYDMISSLDQVDENNFIAAELSFTQEEDQILSSSLIDVKWITCNDCYYSQNSVISWNDIAACDVSTVGAASPIAKSRHNLSYSGSNTYDKTTISLFNISIKGNVALKYTYIKDARGNVQFDDSDTTLVWGDGGYSYDATKLIELQFGVKKYEVPGLTQQLDTAEQADTPPGSISYLPSSDNDSTNQAIPYAQISASFPFCYHERGYALFSCTDEVLHDSRNAWDDPYNIVLSLFDKQNGKFTDILALYNEALIRDVEYLESLPDDYDLAPLKTQINIHDYWDGISNYMQGSYGVLEQIPDKPY